MVSRSLLYPAGASVAFALAVTTVLRYVGSSAGYVNQPQALLSVTALCCMGLACADIALSAIAAGSREQRWRRCGRIVSAGAAIAAAVVAAAMEFWNFEAFWAMILGVFIYSGVLVWKRGSGSLRKPRGAPDGTADAQ